MHHYITSSSADTADFGCVLSSVLLPGDVVLLSGELGAGKSVLARGIARGLDITDNMPSPTFTLMQPYTGRIPLYHFDLYRLNGADAFFEAGLDEFLTATGISVIEWPDCIMAELEKFMCLRISRQTNNEARRITLSVNGDQSRLTKLESVLSKWSAHI